MRFKVFGSDLIVEWRDNGWAVFYAGEGKSRPAHHIVIPPTVKEEALADYLADLLHEFARPGHDEVRRLS